MHQTQQSPAASGPVEHLLLASQRTPGAILSGFLPTLVLAMLLAMSVGVAQAVPAHPGPRAWPSAEVGAVAAEHRLFVNHAAVGTADGLSWENAFTNLQDALTLGRSLAAGSSVEVWVAQGVHFPDVGVGMVNNNRDQAFELANNVALYGGFAGVESSLDARDWLAHPSVLSGDIDGNDDVDADGVASSHGDINGLNSYHVVRVHGADASAVLDGFHISSGQADGPSLIDGTFERKSGAGLYNSNSATTLRNLRIQGNRASFVNGTGGGIHAMSASGSSTGPQLHDVQLIANAAYYGGGLSSSRAGVRASGVNLLHNEAVSGGAVYVNLSVDVNFHNTVMAGNIASGNGGAIWGFRETIALVNSRLTGNFAAGDGGAYYSHGTSSLNLLLTITNVVMSGNRAGGTGGAIHRTLSSTGGTRLWNTIIWGNQDSSGVGTASASHGGPGGARLVAVSSLVQQLLPAGTGNLDGTLAGNAPQFVQALDPANAPSVAGDFHVFPTSPTLEIGDNQARINYIYGSRPPVPLEGNITTDLDGNPRFADSNQDGSATVDLGPYEQPAFSIGGAVSGLVGAGLLLQNNGGDDLAISSNGPFVLPTALPDGVSYLVSVANNPTSPRQTCTATNASGTIAGADIVNILVACSTDDVLVTPSAGPGGSITPSTPQLVPYLSSIDFVLDIDDPEHIAFIDGSCEGSLDGNLFTVAAVEQDCTVEVSFDLPSQTVGGTVSGLVGDGLVLRNNGGDDLTVATDGPFVFPTPVVTPGSYAVTVAVQPAQPRQTCTVGAGSGSVIDADISDVLVSCTIDDVVVTPGAGPGGSISPATPQTIAYLGTAGFEVEAEPGYGIAAVGGSCGGSMTGNTFTTLPVEADCSVDASFHLEEILIFVDPTATGAATGSSWADAFPNLQDALTLARSLAPLTRVEIWAAQGVYHPDVGGGLSGNSRLHAFELASNIALYGGFAGDEQTRDQRDWLAHPTVLSGDIDRNDDVDADGVASSHADINGQNSYHVVRMNEADATTVLDGFSITSGQATGGGLIGGVYLMREGAGLHLRNSTATLANLRVQGNLASMANGSGGGMRLNTTTADTAEASLTNLRVIGNAASRGGGISITRTRVNARSLQLMHNEAGYGGAVDAGLTANLVFQDTVFVANRATQHGGALHGFRDSIALVNSVIAGNRAGGNGGGYYSGGAPGLDLQIVLTNVVVSGNRADGQGGGIYREQGAVGGSRLWNTIIWNNLDSSGTGSASASHGGPGASRLVAIGSLVQGLPLTGAGNLDGTVAGSDPLFQRPGDPAAAPSAAADLHLRAGSPVFDRGDNQARLTPFLQTSVPLEGSLVVDLDGNPRIVDGDGDSLAVVDMGPYEGASYTIGGIVSGLQGQGLMLRNNGGDDLAVNEDGMFTFATVATDAEGYLVTVATQPVLPSQTCTAENTSGNVAGADVTDVQITCVVDEYIVTPTAGSGGSITPSTPQSVPSQATIDFTLTADTGYDLGPVTGSCGGSLDGSIFTIAPMQSDCSVHANFVPQTLSTLAAGANPVRLAQPVEFSVEVQGTDSAPLDGRIDVVADSGESCTDNAEPEVVGLTARFSCSIDFSTLGERQLVASYSASGTHAASTTPPLLLAVRRFADIGVVVDDGQLYVEPGGAAAYLIELRNDGPDAAPNTELVLAADPGLLDAGWLCTALGGAQCPAAAGAGMVALTVDLPADSGLDFVQHGVLAAELPETVLLQAQATVSKTSPDLVFDPDQANNVGTDENVSRGVFGDGFEQP